MMHTVENFQTSLCEAIDARIARSGDPRTELLTLADLNEIIQCAMGKPDWRPEPGYPKTLSKDSPATNSGSLNQRQRGLGVSMKTFYRKVNSHAEHEQAKEEGWL